MYSHHDARFMQKTETNFSPTTISKTKWKKTNMLINFSSHHLCQCIIYLYVNNFVRANELLVNCEAWLNCKWIVTLFISPSLSCHPFFTSIRDLMGFCFFCLLFHHCLRVCSNKMSTWNGRIWRKEKWKKIVKKQQLKKNRLFSLTFLMCVVDLFFLYFCWIRHRVRWIELNNFEENWKTYVICSSLTCNRYF